MNSLYRKRTILERGRQREIDRQTEREREREREREFSCKTTG